MSYCSNEEMILPESIMETTRFYYVVVKGSLHASDSQVFGLEEAEVAALKKRCAVQDSVLNGQLVKEPPVTIINHLSELGYRVLCCSGEAECTWTLAREM